MTLFVIDIGVDVLQGQMDPLDISELYDCELMVLVFDLLDCRHHHDLPWQLIMTNAWQ